MASTAPSLAERARATLESNDRGGHTVPSPHLYPQQWAWDSAFAAIGWAHIDLGRALRELEILLEGQWEQDGRVPHIYFHDLSADYFPGPELWGTERSTTITQPPVWATCLARLHDLGADPGRVKALLPAIDASHEFFAAARDPLGWGAVAVVHPWESGLDNLPAWDQPLQAIDPAEAPPFKRVDLERVDDVGQRPTDDEYQRYVVLVRAIAESGFGPGRFAVYDPLMTALLAQAEGELARLCAAHDVPSQAAARAERLRQGLLEHLWDAELGRFRFSDAKAEGGPAAVTPDVLAAYLPLVLGAQLPEEIRGRLIEGLKAKYATPFLLPSTSPTDPAFDPRRYWRGPVWINMNWLLAPALAGELPLKERSLELMERQGLREYYHPHTGEALGARDFTWSAALALDWLQS